ncbi:hypothetical protein [Dawidia cretensis]|uniref:hypothetical protein n=1 Tax=Dawidia cretensis TaxID=2782350 RepID=UPI0020B2FB3A|nr:hypothetical protein [Dawidia cretensis]
MTLDDIILLGKKILIGIIVTMIPFLILFGGLWFTHKLLHNRLMQNQRQNHILHLNTTRYENGTPYRQPDLPERAGKFIHLCIAYRTHAANPLLHGSAALGKSDSTPGSYC